MKRLNDELSKNNLKDAGYLMSVVFGNEMPYYMIRGDGRDQSMRDDDAKSTEEQLVKFQNFFKGHKDKLPKHVHFLKCDSQKGQENFVMPSTVVSCFAVLRDLIIRNWPLDHVPFNDNMIGGKLNPFDICHTLNVDETAFRRVCILISEEHQ